MDFFKATEGKKPELLPRLLDEYKIDATLLVADAPGPQILDQLKGWKRIYADDIAVIHVRTADAQAGVAPQAETSREAFK
jgi:hypothetical protein